MIDKMKFIETNLQGLEEYRMTYFNNEEYQTLVSDLIGDIFYTSTSYRGKISTLRQYAEIIVRKILDIDPKREITLGDEEIRKRIRKLPNYKVVEKAVKKIKKKGNKTTHTQYRGEVTVEEFNNAVDGLFDLLSYLLISYFEKYKFGSNGSVMHSFSILPPIIRYKVLIFLYKEYPDNISIIDKLVLATLKACNTETATKWIEENKESLLKMNAYSEDFYGQIDLQDPNLVEVLKYIAPPNMYQLCKEKIYQVGTLIHRNGLPYSDFESALPYYKQEGRVQGATPEVQEFNDIMDFLYMGRRERERLFSGSNNSMVVLDIIE